MADEETMHRCVTNFMLDTCHCSNINLSAARAVITRILYETIFDVDSFITGSCAEFFIRPILPYFDDIDIMFSLSNAIAVHGGQEPPSELPDRFQRTVRVYQIVDSNRPGYVYLSPSYYTLKRQNGRYVSVNDENASLGSGRDRLFLRHMPIVSEPCDAWTFDVDSNFFGWRDNSHPPVSLRSASKHGPALLQDTGISSSDLSDALRKSPGCRFDIFTNFDLVMCIHCAIWPVQAAGWPTRHREYGWPDSVTVKTVVSNGCDVVQAVHPLCRQDEWMSEHQWRLSFSRAEVRLLNSWTRLQQIVYHMLRVVIKKELISKANDKYPGLPMLCGYHIKTLMLWACEQKPQRWWSAESYVVKLCSMLINELSDMVSAKCCRHYFLNDCNLVDYFTDYSVFVCNDLNILSEKSFLLHWFAENYVLKCAKDEYSLDEEIEEFRGAGDDELEATVNAFGLVDPNILQYVHHYSQALLLQVLIILQVVSQRHLNIDPGVVVKLVQENDQSFQELFVALTCLHVAYNMSVHSATDRLLDLLCTVLEPCTTGIGRSATVIIEPAITCTIMKAIHLAKTSIKCPRSKAKLYMKISETLLHKSLEHVAALAGDNCELASTKCMAHILLAFLYCKTGHYCTASGHCKQVLSYYDQDVCGLPHIEGAYLATIDVDVDSILGLITFYQHVRNHTLTSSEQSHHDVPVRLTTKVLAENLFARCSTVIENRQRPKCRPTAPSAWHCTRYRESLMQTAQLFISDILLFKTVEHQLSSHINTPAVETDVAVVDEENCASSDMDYSSLVFSLKQVALEKLVVFKKITVNEDDFSVPWLPLNVFEQLYCYNCGLFRECEKIARTNVVDFLNEVFDMSDLEPYVLAFPELLFLLDGSLVSLFGIIRLLRPDLTGALIDLDDYIYILLPLLSLYLLVECQKKLGRYESLSETVNLIQSTYATVRRLDISQIDRLTLNLISRSLRLHIAHTETFSL